LARFHLDATKLYDPERAKVKNIIQFFFARLYYPKEYSHYLTLRENLLVNIYTIWEQTGYMYENYNDTTGSG
jgi:hypothetical protein